MLFTKSKINKNLLSTKSIFKENLLSAESKFSLTLFTHSLDIPFLLTCKAPKTFAISTEIPFVGDFVLTEWHIIIFAVLNEYMFSTTESSVT